MPENSKWKVVTYDEMSNGSKVERIVANGLTIEQANNLAITFKGSDEDPENFIVMEEE